MTKYHGTETLNFEGFTGYYGSVQQGYGGFNWSEVSFLNETYWQDVKTNWCDTGFQNVIDGTGLAYTSAPAGQQTYGYISTQNVNHTFNLVSMIAASAWETNQPFKFSSYAYHHGEGFVLKGSATVYLSQTAQTIKFAKLGNPDTFKDISAIVINGETGSYGNTCSYGAANPTTGYQLAFDDVKIKWNHKVPSGHNSGVPAHPLFGHTLNHNSPAAHLMGNGQSGLTHAGDAAAAATNHHTEHLSLGHDSSGQAVQMHLTGIEHFGP